MNQQLSFEYDLEQSPGQVWRALTEPELLAAWLLPNDFAPVVGRECTFEDDAPIRCEVLEVDPQRKLRLRWREEPALDSEVTFTLTPAIGGGTRLRLVHSGLPSVLRDALPALAWLHAYRCAA